MANGPRSLSASSKQGTLSPEIWFFGDASINGVPIFHEAELNVKAEKWTCLLGASGVGKTTILRLLAGLGDNINRAKEQSSV